MKLIQCTTVRDSLYWMDQIVPGFWDFATKKPLPRKSLCGITKRLDQHWGAFVELYVHINWLKTQPSWGDEDECYKSLLDNAFSPIITREDWSKWVAKTKSR